MLVLAMKPGDTIETDGPCEFKFLKRRGDGCRIGCEAPQTTNIRRRPATEDGKPLVTAQDRGSD